MATRNAKLLGIEVDVVDTTRKHELGIEVDFANGKRYKYIRAGGSIAANDALSIDVAEGVYDYHPSPAAANVILAGVSEVAIGDNEFGWVVVRGPVVVKAAATVVAGKPAVSIATAGTLDDTAADADNALAAGSGVGAIFATTTSGGKATVILS